MKKIFVLVIAVFILVMLIPVVCVLMPGGSEKKITKKGMSINVLIGDSIESRELEEYLFGVVAAEMPAQFHIEALKAQAVAARTYIVNKCQKGDKDHKGADVCTNPDHCKAYLSDGEIEKKFGKDWKSNYAEKIKEAISDTEGVIATYKGEAIEAVFHSTSSGITENAKDVWGSEVEYLVNCESPGDLLSPKYSENVFVDYESFSSLMKNAGYNVASYFGECARNVSGSVREIDVGGSMISGTKIREIFSLPSANFTVSADDKGFTFYCKGKGHGVGMSQYGADYFAKEGKNYEEILKIYYKGIELEKNEHINTDNRN